MEEMTRRRRRLIVGVALVMVPCLGCLTPRGEEDVEVRRAELDARLGDYEGGSETRVAYGGSYYVELRSVGDEGAVMVGLSVDDGLGSLEPGSEQVFDGGRGADALGCGGPSEGYWSFDRHADRIVLRVEQVDPEVRRVYVDATWDDGSTARGSFDYQPSLDDRVADGRER